MLQNHVILFSGRRKALADCQADRVGIAQSSLPDASLGFGVGSVCRSREDMPIFKRHVAPRPLYGRVLGRFALKVDTDSDAPADWAHFDDFDDPVLA